MWIRVLMGLLLSLVMIAIEWTSLAPWQQLSTLVQDTLIRQWAMPLPEDAPVVLVDIDEASIDVMGAWPWSRALVAELVRILYQQYQVRALGLDIVFPETRSEREDAQLVEVVEKFRPILATAWDYVGQKPPLMMGQVSLGEAIGATEFVYPARGFIGNYAQLADASGSGHISPITDGQGIVRYMPLLVSWQAQKYPAMALALWAQVQQRPITELLSPLMTAQSIWTIPYRYQLSSFTVIPAWQVLTGQVPVEFLVGKTVILGSSALGLADRSATPLAPSTPGMLVHAQILSNWLLVEYPPVSSWLRWAGLVSLMLLTSFLLMRYGLKYGLVVLITGIGLSLWWWKTTYQAGAQLPNLGSPLLFLLMWFMLHAALEWSLARRHSERLYRIFRDYLPAHLLQQVIHCSNSDPLEPKHQEVTVLFADIAGFTQMTESMPTPEVVQLTRHVLSLLTEAVYETDGTLDKYMGDALMAFWNAPMTQPNHRRLAVDSALKMRHRLQSLNETRQALALPPIVVRIGIHSGDVLVGDLGTQWRSAYTAMGDTVNIAQRLMLVAGQIDEDIVLSADVAESVALTLPSLTPIGQVSLQGKMQTVSAFVIPITQVIGKK